MPPRRSHKKSRAGCQRCKLRKVKCDEAHPICGNCTKHGVPCDFDDPSALSPPNSLVRYTTPSSSSNSSSTPKPSPSSSTSHQFPPSPNLPFHLDPPLPSTTLSPYSPTSRATELRLLHTYTTLTAPTLAWGDTPPAALAWQLAVPNLAFNTPCLMDALLAIAALHLRALTPSDPSLPRLFHAYMASALSSYTATLHSGVTAENGPALFATAALIAFQASASRRFLNEPGSEAEPYSLPTQWFHAFQGVKTVVIAAWPFLRSSDIRPIISAQPALALDLHPSRPAFFDDLLVGLDEQLLSLEEGERDETRRAYEHSVAYLNWAHARPEKARIVGFPATVSRRFIELVDRADSRALAVIASFFAMTRAVDGAWWLSGVARKEVRGILGLLDEEWRERVGWA
ncbi:hypothetical protein V501_06132, partial [Pseudogymnoascus sp. VKM F-4519 (FW-2642)]